MPETPPAPARFPVTVDVVALTVRDGALNVLLITRLIEPFRGKLALPGGFVLAGEELLEAASRELAEETGVEHLPGIWSNWAVTVPRGATRAVTSSPLPTCCSRPTFPCCRQGATPSTRPGTPLARSWTATCSWPSTMSGSSRTPWSGRSQNSNTRRLGAAFCGEEFTIAQLRAVYEAVWGTRLDPRNFHRKATGTPDFLEDTGRMTAGDAGRPAALFRLAAAARPAAGQPTRAVLNPPLMRSRP